ncbi:MAG: AraC family transcriptional regulator [Polaromonas sp.]|nr:AraC family transcriptional regulator [Polaromonas sp.]
MERAPHPALAGLVRSVWLSTPAAPPAPAPSHELMMPTGEMHLVLRLTGPSIAVFDGLDDPVPKNFGHAVVNGARAGAYAKPVAAGSASIGLQLQPGASQALLGLPADELAGRHVRLEDLWGSDAGLLHERLLGAPSAGDKLRCLEAFLMTRLQRSPAPGAHPAVLAGLQQLHAGGSVAAAARHSGYSQRQFMRLFVQAVGLPPRLYLRVQRFQKALRLMQDLGSRPACLADAAFGAGYTDQPHFNRDFREFAALTPRQYRAARPAAASHVPVSWAAGSDGRFVQDRRKQAA